MDALYDPIRARNVAGTPEEAVRQRVIRLMLDELDYPKGLLAVEKEFGEVGRRADLVCYASCESKGLRPLLIVECKAQRAEEKALEQAFGYNACFGAPFIALADADSIHTFWFDGSKISSVPFLPLYRDLQRAFSSR